MGSGYEGGEPVEQPSRPVPSPIYGRLLDDIQDELREHHGGNMHRVSLLSWSYALVCDKCTDPSMIRELFHVALDGRDATLANCCFTAWERVTGPFPDWRLSTLLEGAHRIAGVLTTLEAMQNPRLLLKALETPEPWTAEQLASLFFRVVEHDAFCSASEMEMRIRNDPGLVKGLVKRTETHFNQRPSRVSDRMIKIVELLASRHPKHLLEMRFACAPLPKGYTAPDSIHRQVNALPEALAKVGFDVVLLWRIIRADNWPVLVLMRTLEAAVVNYAGAPKAFAENKPFAQELLQHILGNRFEDTALVVKMHISGCTMRHTVMAWTHECEHIKELPILLGTVLYETAPMKGLMKGLRIFDAEIDAVIDMFDWSTTSLIAAVEEAMFREDQKMVGRIYKKLTAEKRQLPDWWRCASDEYRCFLSRALQKDFDLTAYGERAILAQSLPCGPHQDWDAGALAEALTMAITLDNRGAVGALLHVMDKPIPIELPRFLKCDFDEVSERKARKRLRVVSDRSDPVTEFLLGGGGPASPPRPPPPLPRELFLSHVARTHPTYLPDLLTHPPSRAAFQRKHLADTVVSLLGNEVAMVNEQAGRDFTIAEHTVLKQRIAANTTAIEQFLLPPISFTSDDLPAQVADLLRGRLEDVVSRLYEPPDPAQGTPGGRGYHLTLGSFTAVASGAGSSSSAA